MCFPRKATEPRSVPDLASGWAIEYTYLPVSSNLRPGENDKGRRRRRRPHPHPQGGRYSRTTAVSLADACTKLSPAPHGAGPPASPRQVLRLFAARLMSTELPKY